MSSPEVERSRSQSLPASTMSPIETYCALMEEVKLRLAFVRRFTRGEITLGRDDFDAETLCVHLRKILEAIAFGSLVAHCEVYETAHQDIHSCWRAKEMLTRIGKVHPNFYPQPKTPRRIDGKVSLEQVAAGFLTQSDFQTLYDKCSAMLHFQNPFRSGSRTMDFGRSLNDWCDLIENLLRHHVVWLWTGGEPHVCVDGVPQSGEGWLIYLSHPDDSRARAFLFAPMSDAGAAA